MPPHRTNHGGKRILIRASVLVAGWAVFFLLVMVSSTSGGDANIGIGLLAFLLVVGAAAAWGWYDVSRMPYPVLAVTWGVVGLLMGLIVPLFTAVGDNEFDVRVVASDIVTGMPFMAILIAGPALVAGALGLLIRGSRPTGG